MGGHCKLPPPLLGHVARFAVAQGSRMGSVNSPIDSSKCVSGDRQTNEQTNTYTDKQKNVTIAQSPRFAAWLSKYSASYRIVYKPHPENAI